MERSSRGTEPATKSHDCKQDDGDQNHWLQRHQIDGAEDLVPDRVSTAVRDRCESFSELSDRQRDCGPLSESRRTVRTSLASEPPSGETDDGPQDHMEDRMPRSDIDVERRPDGSSKNQAEEDSSEQDERLASRRSRLDAADCHR